MNPFSRLIDAASTYPERVKLLRQRLQARIDECETLWMTGAPTGDIHKMITKRTALMDALNDVNEIFGKE